MPRILLLSFFLLLQNIFCLVASAQPQVSASIKPLQLIAAAITAGVSEPGLIIGPGQDPHHPALRPSERRTLYEADILLWVGPQLEAALADLIDDKSLFVLTAYELIEAAGLVIEVTGNIEANAVTDPHLWLSTQNTRIIARALAERLQELDFINRPRYESNLADFLLALDSLDLEIARSLTGLENIPFAVYHNAFQYYEKQFGLRHIVSFTGNEEIQPGIRKVLEIRASLSANNVSCLLLEPANNPNEITQLSGRSMRMHSIDVLGFDYAPGPTAYSAFMSELTKSISECLQP